MYLPTFPKLTLEKTYHSLRRYGSFGIPAGLWCKVLFIHLIYIVKNSHLDYVAIYL